MIHVVATLTIDPTRREDFLSAFAALTPLVRAEEGCLEYGLTEDQPTDIPVQQLVGDAAVVVVEKWESVPHLEAHLAAPHMAAYREQTADIVQSVTLQVLRPAV